MKTNFTAWISKFAAGSAICRGLNRLTSYIYKKLKSGLYGFTFGSYDTVCETFDDSATFSLAERIGRGKLKRKIASDIEESVYVSAASSVMRYLSRLSLRVIGVLLMSGSFFAFIVQMVRYLIAPSDVFAANARVYAVSFLFGLPLLFFNKALCVVVRESPILGRFFAGFCELKERSFVCDGKPTGRKNAAFIMGMVIGALSIFLKPVYFPIAVVGLIAAYMVLISPEFGLYTTIFVLPFLVLLPRPSILLACLALYTTFSYVVKIMRGKRYFKLELLDVLVLCFMLATLLGGIVSYGGTQSIKAAAIYTALSVGYFLAVGILDTKKKLKKAVLVLCFSLLLVSAYGVYQNITGSISSEWIDTDMFDNIAGRVVSTFENPNMLGEYLIILLPVIFASAIGNKSWLVKPVNIAAFFAGCVCLVYTWARGAWLGFIIASVLLMLMITRHSLAFVVAGICALPALIPFLPANIVARFSSIGNLTDTSTNYRVYIWRGSVRLASDYALTGIGIGEDAFNRIYPYYSFAGIEKAPHAHNLYLQIFIELGIIGFAIFLAVLIAFLQSGFSLAKNGKDKELRLIGCGAMCGVIAALAQGMTDYVWYNYRVFFVFWFVFGLASAARRIDSEIRTQKPVNINENAVDITL